MSDDGIHDELDEPYEPRLVCPDCEGPLEGCVCDDEDIVFGGALEPYWTRDGDDPGRVRRSAK